MSGDGATCLLTQCFCEAVRDAGIAQPANAWSSLVFVVAAIAVLPVRRLAARRERTIIGLFAAALAAVGAGSFVFHATLDEIGQFADVWPMAALATVVLGGALVRTGLLRAAVVVPAGCVVLAGLAGVLWAWPETRRYAFVAILLPGIVLEIWRSRMPLGSSQPAHWLWAGLGVMTAAYGVWVLDQTDLLCSPTSVLQGHAVWHVLGAIAAWCLARHWAATSDPSGAGHGRSRSR
ncbi:MAG: ceramidase [Micrococcales bacterium]|nr:ceramidase [Micrococcales bacterium]